MKIFLDADIKTTPANSNSSCSSPFLRASNNPKGISPAFMKKEHSFNLSGILANQHPVMLSWLIISFILISAMYIYCFVAL